MATLKLVKDHLYSRGAARFSDLIYLSIKDRKLDRRSVAHSRILGVYKGQVGSLKDVTWRTAGMCVVKKPSERLVTVGENGDVFTYVAGKGGDETVDPRPFELRGCNSIGGYAYACGMKRQAYRRAGEGRWIDMSAPAGDGKRICGFEAIGGFSEADIYAVGWEGEIWQNNKGKWIERSSPVNVILTGVCCASDKTVYACGQNGTLVKGRNAGWEALDQGDLEDDLWDICEFEKKVYAASMSALYELRGARLVPVNFGKDAPKSCYKLTQAEGVLWSVGQENLFSFDGNKWTRWD